MGSLEISCTEVVRTQGVAGRRSHGVLGMAVVATRGGGDKWRGGGCWGLQVTPAVHAVCCEVGCTSHSPEWALPCDTWFQIS